MRYHTTELSTTPFFNDYISCYTRDFDGRPYSYTYRHYAEPRHATEAITTAAQEYMHQHAERNAVKAPEEGTVPCVGLHASSLVVVTP